MHNKLSDYKSSEQWRYLTLSTNLYKLQAMQMFKGTTIQNLVFIFSIKINNLNE
jgi:hypothetical protein